ncbi:hypothetical protein GIB67_026965, partial [Kingdonia uniflora]
KGERKKEIRVSLNSSSISLDIRSNKTKSRSNESRLIWSKTLESLHLIQTTIASRSNDNCMWAKFQGT